MATRMRIKRAIKNQEFLQLKDSFALSLAHILDVLKRLNCAKLNEFAYFQFFRSHFKYI